MLHSLGVIDPDCLLVYHLVFCIHDYLPYDTTFDSLEFLGYRFPSTITFSLRKAALNWTWVKRLCRFSKFFLEIAAEVNIKMMSSLSPMLYVCTINK